MEGVAKSFVSDLNCSEYLEGFLFLFEKNFDWQKQCSFPLIECES